ncbi:5114_t:CDS:2 [Dentiscutata heterogama]|uniref:5114_t:CDS:1 n=1 Tax=Dentiscutata heterogama TaxID=1316150 RepID=A0ACA9LZR0_9GLOM|nr:5114_t:CDS:2 [Dentiscutata heterogama]
MLNENENISQSVSTKKDVDKQNHTKLIIDRINGTLLSILATNTPTTNSFDWPVVLTNFRKKKNQIQHDLGWEEFFLRINHSKMIYLKTAEMDEKKRKKAINELIKQPILSKSKANTYNGNEFSQWKKFHQLSVLFF